MLVAWITESPTVIDVKSQFWIYGLRLDVIGLKALIGSAEYAFVVVAQKDRFAPMQLFGRLAVALFNWLAWAASAVTELPLHVAARFCFRKSGIHYDDRHRASPFCDAFTH